MGLNINKLNKFSHKLKLVHGSAVALPFKKNQFDVMICTDMLEHLASNDRNSALQEMLQATKKILIVAVPCGKLSEKYEQGLNKFYRRIYKRDHYWLKEHLQNGLPRQVQLNIEFAKILQRYNMKAKIQVSGNVNLKIWYLLNLMFYLPGIMYFQRLLFAPFFKLISKSSIQ